MITARLSLVSGVVAVLAAAGGYGARVATAPRPPTVHGWTVSGLSSIECQQFLDQMYKGPLPPLDQIGCVDEKQKVGGGVVTTAITWWVKPAEKTPISKACAAVAWPGGGNGVEWTCAASFTRMSLGLRGVGGALIWHVKLVFLYHLGVAEGVGRTTVTASRQSANWSGYTMSSPGHALAGVSGYVVVPRVTGGSATSRIAIWDGLGTGPGIIQAGVDGSPRRGWGTWWEAFPGPPHPVRLAVATGDMLSITVVEAHPASGAITAGDVFHSIPEVWRITIRNLTTGRRWDTLATYSGPTTSAEWIVEAPNKQTVPLSAATTVRFSHCAVAGASATRILTPVLMTGGGAGVQATPSYYVYPSWTGPMPGFSVKDWVPS